MTSTLKLFVASAALTAAIGLPAWSAMHVPSPGEVAKSLAVTLESGSDPARLILVDDDNDDDDDDENGDAKWKQRHSGHDDDGDRDDDDDDDDCEDDDDSCGSAKVTAPAGTVAPPQNGLFSNGTAPKAQVK
jgi:hypothetical protein